jgi:RNA polymerase sigma factor (sigma-70 family)
LDTDVDELRDLVTRARDGDLEAYARIVGRFQAMAAGCAYSLLGDFHLAEDAAQEAFVQAYRDLATLREPAAFPGWLRRIVFKHCDRLTRGKRVRTAPLEAAAGVAADEPGPADLAERREMQGRVLDAIRGLPEHERMVTTLFYIDGYSQQAIAEFLEVPTSTVKNRLHASRKRLRERMIGMVEDALRHNAPDERFSRKVIDQLLARPRPLDIEGHPVRRVWDLLRAALPDHEVVAGDEIEGRAALQAVEKNLDRAYRAGHERFLRTQMTITTLKAIRGRTPPVRLLAAGRVFRPDPEDATHVKVFHQVDGIRIERGADLAALKATLRRAFDAVLPAGELRWTEHDFGFVEQGFEVAIQLGGEWLDVSGCGILKAQTLRDAGFEPAAVGGFAWGLGLERLAMARFCIDDVRTLWQPPYV